MANSNPSPSTRWQKGQSGNPTGRPSFSLKQRLEEALDEKKSGDKTRLDNILEELIQLAEQGDIRAISLLFDRLEGKPKMMLEDVTSRTNATLFFPAFTIPVEAGRNIADGLRPDEARRLLKDNPHVPIK